MAHNLNIVDGVASMMYNKKEGNPWHNLGTPTDGAVTTSEALRIAKLEWTVEKRPLFTTMKDSYIEVPNVFANVRSDNNAVLGTVKGRYHIVQNTDNAEFIDSIVGALTPTIETAGALGAGEKVWMALHLPEVLKVKSEEIQQYLLLSWSHDGSSPIQCDFTPIRPVCQNTLSAALSGMDARICIRHTRTAKERLLQSQQLIGLVRKQSEQAALDYNVMANTDVKTQANVDKFLNELFGEVNPDNDRTKNIHSAVRTLFVSGKGNAGKTVWDLYNGVTEYVDHERSVRSDTNITEAAIFGSGVAIKAQAFAAAMALVKSV